jgi:hypothetical protein
MTLSAQIESRLAWPEKVLVGGEGPLSVYEAEREEAFFLLLEDDAAGDAVIRFESDAERRHYALARELPLFPGRLEALTHLTKRLEAREP